MSKNFFLVADPESFKLAGGFLVVDYGLPHLRGGGPDTAPRDEGLEGVGRTFRNDLDVPAGQVPDGAGQTQPAGLPPGAVPVKDPLDSAVYNNMNTFYLAHHALHLKESGSRIQ